MTAPSRSHDPGTAAGEPFETPAPLWRGGAHEPLDDLADQCYAELLVIARRARRRAQDVATLDTHALLHETFLRLTEQRQTGWADRPHFLAAAACTMRRVLIDYVRRRHSAKRGGTAVAVTFDDDLAAPATRDETLLALDEALEHLAVLAPRLAQVVEQRYFAGMTEAETAAVLGVSERTVRRDWIKARGWLLAQMAEGR